jgi:hypothetical protein
MSMAPRSLLCVLVVLAGAVPSAAQSVMISGFGGFRMGGGFIGASNQVEYDLANRASFGGILDIATSKTFRIEFLFSRQLTEIAVDDWAYGPTLPLTVDVYQAGIMEEKGEGKGRAIGALLFGATRFIPDAPGLQDQTHFSTSLMLGGKYLLSKNIALRADARGIVTFVSGGGGAICGGGRCLVSFTGSTIFQPEVTAGLTLAF